MYKNRIWEKIITYFLRVIYIAIMLFPILWITLTALKPIKQIVSIPVIYIPKPITFDNFIGIWESTKFPVYFKNSLIVSLTTGAIVSFLSILAGYSLARFEFRGKKLTYLMFLVTQMIPAVVVIIPIFIMYGKLNLINNLFGLIIVYTVGNIPFCTLMLRSFFENIPKALEEAAVVDGCTRLTALYKIVLPIMRPGIIASFVFAFIGAWSDLFFNIMFISKESLKTIPTGINAFIGKYSIDWGMLSAGAVIALVPVTVLFMFVQKYIVKGLTAGAVKG
jgi:multiple sugar transport system permease protein